MPPFYESRSLPYRSPRPEGTGERIIMQCITPMFRRYIVGDHSDGKIVSRAEVMQGLELNENNIRFCLQKMNTLGNKYRYETVPCKKCWACQLNYSAEWATRIMVEAQRYTHNYFVTLTYDDQNVPIMSEIEYVEEYKENGEITDTKQVRLENDGTWGYSLAPDHMKTFLNTLRKRLERNNHYGVKYFYCGEYGTETHRPHYHIILMNCPLEIEQFYDTHIDTNFKAHWKSHELEEIWTKGMIDIAELEWSCAAYVARYCTKKLDFTQDKRVYLNKGLIPEYVRMSKGIGFEYYLQHKNEIYKNDEMIMRTVKGNVGSMKPPKAFDRKFKETDPKGFRLIQESRKKAAQRSRKMIQSITDMTDLQMIRLRASNLETKMQLLPRAGDL